MSVHDISEAAFQRRICDLCDWLGLLYFHDTDSRRNRAGWPDLFIVGPSGDVLILELKSAKGRIRPEQRLWLDALGKQHDARVVRPDDWDEVEAALKALARTGGAA